MEVISNNRQTAVPTVVDERQAALTIAPGFQGTGKTYRTLHDIIRYLRLHPDRKVLIYDVNGEFNYESCKKHGIDINIPVLGTSIADIQRFTFHQTERIRRIIPNDPKTGERLDIAGMKNLLKDILTHFRKGFLLIEDMNKYLLQVRHIEEIVSILVSLRHQNLDVVIHLQSLAKIDPTLWENTKFIRMHWQTDSVDRIKARITNYRLYKIAQLLVNYMYEDVDDATFFCYVYPQKNKISGNFSKQDFKLAYYRYLKSERTELKDCMNILRVRDNAEGRKTAVNYLFERALGMYGNAV